MTAQVRTVIRIMIVEDQTMVREALKGSLAGVEDFSVIASIADAALAPLYCERTKPDLVLMDVCTENDSSGLDAAEIIKQKFPRAHAAGADSFIYKDAPLDELEKVIRGTFEGGSFYPRPHASELNFDELTRREKEILRLICDGLSRKEICDALGITINSVKTHFANILSKTGYESVAKLAIYAVSHGFINTQLKHE